MTSAVTILLLSFHYRHNKFPILLYKSRVVIFWIPIPVGTFVAWSIGLGHQTIRVM